MRTHGAIAAVGPVLGPVFGPVFGLVLGLVLVITPAARSLGDSDTTVHLTKAQALAHVFPDAEQVVELRQILSAQEIEAVEALTHKRLAEGGFYLYAALRDGTPTGYAAIVAEIGKVKPITHIVSVNPAGEVGRVAVMIYRESHGDEVAGERFMQQYSGKTLGDPIRVDRDVINIAGATLSGHAVCRGVRKALAAVQVVMIDRSPDDRARLLATGTDVTPARPERKLSTLVPSPDGPQRMQAERQVMGTVCRLEAWTDGDPGELAAALEAALDEVARWDAVLSNWREDTPLSRLNRSPPGTAVEVDADLLAWLVDSRHWAGLTGGAFDPAMGALVDAWGLNTMTPARPGDERLEDALGRTGLARLTIDRESASVTRHTDVRLDPGASGKGFALDRAAEVLRRRGVTRALLSFRSTLLALEPPPGRDAWDVPVVHDGDDTTVTTVQLVNAALSVSGGAFHAFVDRDTERGHVIDPHTGVPVRAGRLAWVRHPSASAADALSTALLVRGIELAGVDPAQGGFLAAAGESPSIWP